MKVCTDACLFGAYVAQNENNTSGCSVIDVGAGTGLLSLMWNQMHPASQVTLLEPDLGSYSDMLLNTEPLLHSGVFLALPDSLEGHVGRHLALYDVVICNPPFFLNSLQSEVDRRNRALHVSEIQWSAWCLNLRNLVKPTGKIWLLLEPNIFEKSKLRFVETGLHVAECVILTQFSRVFRVVLCLVLDRPFETKEWVNEIRGTDGKLSEWAGGLLAPFYDNKFGH